jgi:hypothetical protein
VHIPAVSLRRRQDRQYAFPRTSDCYQHLASRLSAVACSDVTISYCIESGAMPAADYMLKMDVAHAGGFLEASTISLLGHLSYIV